MFACVPKVKVNYLVDTTRARQISRAHLVHVLCLSKPNVELTDGLKLLQKEAANAEKLHTAGLVHGHVFSCVGAWKHVCARHDGVSSLACVPLNTTKKIDSLSPLSLLFLTHTQRYTTFRPQQTPQHSCTPHERMPGWLVSYTFLMREKVLLCREAAGDRLVRTVVGDGTAPRPAWCLASLASNHTAAPYTDIADQSYL